MKRFIDIGLQAHALSPCTAARPRHTRYWQCWSCCLLTVVPKHRALTKGQFNIPGVKVKYVVISFSTRTEIEKGLFWITINLCFLSFLAEHPSHGDCCLNICNSSSRNQREGSVPFKSKVKTFYQATFTSTNNVKRLHYSHMKKKQHTIHFQLFYIAASCYTEIKFGVN